MKWFLFSALTLVVCGAGLQCRSAQPVDPADRSRSPGRNLYVTHCASCHGLDARGDGAEAGSSSTPPSDLTRLRERYGRPLPVEPLAEFVDGRHTDRPGNQMPAFGEKFFEGMPYDANREYAKRIAIILLIDYLESLQAGPIAPTGPSG